MNPDRPLTYLTPFRSFLASVLQVPPGQILPGFIHFVALAPVTKPGL